ncbi:zinc finger protein 358 [Drosophila ficusphila]|uniref:zinc finger protein 358 n=1 Tax=Drosophila ficusphila TaxID=30025 RepID=UPI0007E7902A|nr:zinc finger protein 358 [Drosophila ficusphila]
MDSSTCRVCLNHCENMVNIFNLSQSSGISIAKMISEWSGFQVKIDDFLPNTICQSCLKDAENAYQITENSSKLFYHTPEGKKIKEEVDEICESSRDEPLVEMNLQDKEDLPKDQPPRQEQFQDIEDPPDDSFPCQVNPKPLKEIVMETKDCHKLNQNLVQSSIPAKDSIINPVYLYNDTINKPETEVAKDNGGSKKTMPKRRHPSSPPIKCSICLKTFTTRSGLKTHNKIHTGERYNCPRCSWSFTRRSTVMRHLKSFPGEPHKCPLCPKTFCNIVHFHSHDCNGGYRRYGFLLDTNQKTKQTKEKELFVL